MNQIFRAPACGQLHLIESGEPVAHKCTVQHPEGDFLGTRSGDRADNPVSVNRVHSRREPDETVPAPQAFAEEQRRTEYYRRKMNPAAVSDNLQPDEDVDDGAISSMAAAKQHYQENRPQLRYAPNPAPACPVAQPSARPLKSNPLPKSLDECEVKSSGEVRRENPVSTDDPKARRCEILQVRHANKFPGNERISCAELEQKEGPAYDLLLARGLASLTPERRAEMVAKNSDYARILRDYPNPPPKYASNPVSSETIERAKSKAAPHVELPLAQPQNAATKDVSAKDISPKSASSKRAPSTKATSSDGKDTLKTSTPKAPTNAPEQNQEWRARRIPVPQAMQFVLNLLQFSARDYPSLARLRTERASKVSLSMIDFAIKDAAKLAPLLRGDDMKNAKALLNDLKLVRSDWRNRATLVVDGTDSLGYQVNEMNIKL